MASFSGIVTTRCQLVTIDAHGFMRLLLASFLFQRRCSLRCLFYNFVSYVIPRFTCPKYCVLLRRHDDCRRSAGRCFASVVSYGIPSLSLASFGILNPRALGIRFLALCRIVSISLSTLTSNVCLATLLVGFPALCHIVS